MSNSRIEPHGGQICDRMVTEESIGKLKQNFIHLQSWTLNDRQICDLEMIMNGGFSPLIGFLDQEDYDAVCTGMRLKNNDLWPIPITLDVTENTAEKLAKKGKLVLRDKEGFSLAVMKIGNIWKPDRKKEAGQVYGTLDETHPGVNYLLHESNPIYIGGSVEGVHVPCIMITRTCGTHRPNYGKNLTDWAGTILLLSRPATPCTVLMWN